jgi:hypothetical protein
MKNIVVRNEDNAVGKYEYYGSDEIEVSALYFICCIFVSTSLCKYLYLFVWIHSAVQD